MVGAAETQSLLEQVLEQQLGVLSRWQAREYGYTDRQIDHRVSSGEWRAMYRSVFLTTGGIPTYEQQVIAATLSMRGYASHQTAAYMYAFDGFDEAPPSRVILTVRDLGAPKPQQGVEIVKTRELHPRDIGVAGHAIATSEVRTLIDLAPEATNRQLVLAFEDVVRRKLWRELLQRVEALENGRGGLEKLKKLLHRRGTDPKPTESAAEALCDHALLTEGHMAERQVEVKYRGRRARIDLAFIEHGIAIECDSELWHNNWQRKQADMERDGWLAEYGWHVLRFSWAQIQDCDRLVKRVERTIARRKGLPPPKLTG